MAYSCIYPSGYTLSTAEQTKYPTGKRFTSLATWEAQNLDLVTAQDSEICEILPGDATYNWGTAGADSRVDINGWITSSAYNIEIVVLPDARHTGTWNLTKHRIEYDGWDTAFTCRTSNVKLVDFQIKKGNASDTGVAFNLVNCDNISFINTLFWRPTTAAQGWGFGMSSQRTGLYVENCIFYGGSFRTIFTDSYNENSVEFLNCTIVDCVDRGLAVTSGPGVLTTKNCYVGNSGIADYQGAVMTTCASSDTTGSAGLQSIAVATGSGARFSNVTAGSEDFSITIGSDLIDVGTDLSTDFTGDIAGNTRGATWDIGAFEFAGSGATTISPNSGDHSHLADVPTITTYSWVIAPAESVHSVLSDSPILNHNYSVSVNEAFHSVTSSQPAIALSYSVAPTDALHAHSADNAGVSIDGLLTPYDASQALSSDSPIVVSHITIAMHEGAHTHQSTQPGIVPHYLISTDENSHAVTVESPALSVGMWVIPADTIQNIDSDLAVIAATIIANPADTFHSVMSDTIFNGIINSKQTFSINSLQMYFLTEELSQSFTAKSQPFSTIQGRS